LAIERVKAPEELPNGQPLRLTRGGRQAVGTGIIPLPRFIVLEFTLRPF
jgi:hypothetical protein